MREQIEYMYDNYCKIRKLTKEQGEVQTWGKEPMIEFAEQAFLYLRNISNQKQYCQCTEEPFWEVGGKCVSCGLGSKIK